jgi:hypothetical protein
MGIGFRAVAVSRLFANGFERRQQSKGAAAPAGNQSHEEGPASQDAGLRHRVHTLEAERQEPETEEIAAAPPQQALPAPQPLPRPQTQPPLQTVVAANPVKIFGAAKLDLFYNTARPQAPGVPFFMGPSFVGGFPQNTVDINARQSQLGVAFIGPMIGNFKSGGKISAVFFDLHLTGPHGFRQHRTASCPPMIEVRRVCN